MTRKNIVPPYIPNYISPKLRLWYLVASIFLLLYGAYSIWIDDLFIPAKRGGGFHLHKLNAWFMYLALVCASIVMLSIIVDHYDKRNNEIKYERLSSRFQQYGWIFFWIAVISNLLQAMSKSII